MRFDFFLPCSALSAEVACFIIAESDSQTPYTVLPDTGLVMGFQYRGALSLVTSAALQPLALSGITGLQRQYRRFQNLTATGSVLVKFKPGGAAAFFRAPVHELYEQSCALDLLTTRHAIRLVEEQLAAATSDTARIRCVEAFLLSSRNDADEDRLVAEAIRRIIQSAGVVRISALAAQLHTSQSPLEKRFRSRVGASPKKFAGIVRFQSILASGSSDLRAAGLAYDAGYFDQAHFINDFRRFSGQTPEAFFGKKVS